MTTKPTLTADYLLVNHSWSKRIVDAEVAQALARAGLDDLRYPLSETSTCRTATAFALLQNGPAAQTQRE